MMKQLGMPRAFVFVFVFVFVFGVGGRRLKRGRCILSESGSGKLSSFLCLVHTF